MNIDLYGSHKEYLLEVVKFKKRFSNALEFGMGNYSTKILIENSDKCVSVEMQSPAWFNEMLEKFQHNKNWTPHFRMGATEFLNITYDDFYDFCFVDGHQDSRPECVNFMMSKKCPIIMSHDTESVEYYGWDRVLKNDYKRVDFKKHPNWTSLWTLDQNLYDHMCNFGKMKYE